MPITRVRLLVVPALLLALGGLSATVASAGTAGSGIFHTVCAYSHSLPDDPIARPNMPGMSHMHDFGGNRRVEFEHARQRPAGVSAGPGTGCTERRPRWMR